MSTFSRLVRFIAKDGKTYYGDAVLPKGITDIAKITQAKVIEGPIFGKHSVTNDVKEIKTLLSPLSQSDIRTVRCLGLNYSKHAAESGLPEPTSPVLFYKPVTSIGGPFDTIPVAPVASGLPGLDYECELVVIIGKACRDVSRAQALSHVLGYAVGNDVSHREWQLKKGGGQWSLGKGFDGWAPFGPGIVSSRLLPEGGKGLKIKTKVNGVPRQEDSTSDLIFGVAETVAFLSQGTTLMPGDLIFTGTPSGVAMGMKPEPKWLKDGDVVEVSLEGVGTITNRVHFVMARTKL